MSRVLLEKIDPDSDLGEMHEGTIGECTVDDYDYNSWGAQERRETAKFIFDDKGVALVCSSHRHSILSVLK